MYRERKGNKFWIPGCEVWLSLAAKSLDTGSSAGKEATKDSGSVSSLAGTGVSTTEENLNESEINKWKARPTKRNETANFIMTLLCLGGENGFTTDLISFTIWFQRDQQILFDCGREKKRRSVN
jgi:hypothetical protein